MDGTEPGKQPQQEFGTVDVNYDPTVQGIVSDGNENLFISCGAAVLKMDAVTRIIETWVGSPSHRGDNVGSRLSTRMKEPYGLRFVRGSNFSDLLVCDWSGERILLVQDDEVFVFAGTGAGGKKDGPKLKASFSGPYDIQETSTDGLFLVNDWGNHLIRAITPAGFVITVSSEFNYPRGITASPFGDIYISDSGSSRIVELVLGKFNGESFESVQVKHIAGEGRSDPAFAPQAALSATFQYPTGILYTEKGLVIADHSSNMMRLLDFSDPEHTISPIASNAIVPDPSFQFHTPLCNFTCLTPLGDLWWTEENQRKLRFIPSFSRPNELELFSNFWNLFFEPSSTLLGDRSPTNLRPDATISLSKSDRSIELHSWLLALIRIQTNSTVPFDASTALKSCLEGLENPEIEIILRLLYGATVYQIESLLPTDHFQRVMCLAKVSTSLKRLLNDDSEGLLSLFVPALTRLSNDPSLLWHVLLVLLDSDFAATSNWIHCVCRFLSHHGKPSSNAPKFEKSFAQLDAVLKLIEEPSLISASTLNNKVALHPIAAHMLAMNALATAMKLAPLSALQQSLASSNSDLQQPNFVVCIAESDQGILVHDWLLYCRWPYFKRIIDSCLSEVDKRTVELPAGCTSDKVLLEVFRFMYTQQLPTSKPSNEAQAFMKAYGTELGFSDLDDLPFPGFKALFAQ